MKSSVIPAILKGASALVFSAFSLVYAADQKIDLTAELIAEGEIKSCKITYIDASTKSNCTENDNCNKGNECICVEGGTHIQWKAKGGGQNKFKFQVAQLPALFEDDAKCKLDQFKSTHHCKVKANPEPGRHKYDFVGKFKSDDAEYNCQYDPIIVIKASPAEAAPTNQP